MKQLCIVYESTHTLTHRAWNARYGEASSRAEDIINRKPAPFMALGSDARPFQRGMSCFGTTGSSSIVEYVVRVRVV